MTLDKRPPTSATLARGPLTKADQHPNSSPDKMSDSPEPTAAPTLEQQLKARGVHVPADIGMLSEAAAQFGGHARIALKGVGTGNNPASKAVLTPFPPGVSGNPGGKIKGSKAYKTAHAMLVAAAPAAAGRIVKQIAAADDEVAQKAAKDVLDRVLGKAVQRTEVTHPDAPAEEQSTDVLLARMAELETLLSDRAVDVTPASVRQVDDAEDAPDVADVDD